MMTVRQITGMGGGGKLVGVGWGFKLLTTPVRIPLSASEPEDFFKKAETLLTDCWALLEDSDFGEGLD